jgi:hypothetical protein
MAGRRGTEAARELGLPPASLQRLAAAVTLRSLIQSARWPRAWNLLATEYRQTVTVLASHRYADLPLAA